MKKVIYLLIVALSFAACKKDNDTEKNNEVNLIKGKWKFQSIKCEFYDSSGKLLYSDSHYLKKWYFTVTFDHNNVTIVYDKGKIVTSPYVYKNGILKTADIAAADGTILIVKELTANSMGWQVEYAYDILYQNSVQKPDELPGRVDKLIMTTKFTRVKQL